MKRIISFLLLVAPLVLTGCGSKSEVPILENAAKPAISGDRRPNVKRISAPVSPFAEEIWGKLKDDIAAVLVAPVSDCSTVEYLGQARSIARALLGTSDAKSFPSDATLSSECQVRAVVRGGGDCAIVTPKMRKDCETLESVGDLLLGQKTGTESELATAQTAYVKYFLDAKIFPPKDFLR